MAVLATVTMTVGRNAATGGQRGYDVNWSSALRGSLDPNPVTISGTSTFFTKIVWLASGKARVQTTSAAQMSALHGKWMRWDGPSTPGDGIAWEIEAGNTDSEGRQNQTADNVFVDGNGTTRSSTRR